MDKILSFIETDGTHVNWKLKQKFVDCVKNLKKGTYSIEVKPVIAKRTSKQNAAKFGVIYKAMQGVLEEALGEYLPIYAANDDIASVHRLLLVKCAPLRYVEAEREKFEASKIVDPISGEILFEKEFRLTSTNMTTVEEMEFIENIRRFAMDYFGSELPEFEKQNK